MHEKFSIVLILLLNFVQSVVYAQYVLLFSSYHFGPYIIAKMKLEVANISHTAVFLCL